MYHRGDLDQQALCAGLDLSRKRVDVCVLDERGGRVAVTAAPPDGDGLRGLADRLAGCVEPICAALKARIHASLIAHGRLRLGEFSVL
jgi:hypothetical protein